MTVGAKRKWSSGSGNRYGFGPYVFADSKIFLLDDSGVLTIVKADPQNFIKLARVKVLQGKETWGPIAVVHGLMLMRDFEELVCLDLRKIKVAMNDI